MSARLSASATVQYNYSTIFGKQLVEQSASELLRHPSGSGWNCSVKERQLEVSLKGDVKRKQMTSITRETKGNEEKRRKTKRNKEKRRETKRNEAKRSETKRDEEKRRE